jgi:NifU-like protein involved in Fe-S cluster formation
VKEHFFSPKNVLKTQKEVKEFERKADAVGQVGSPVCGDVMKVWIIVKDGKIAACKWQTFGCASAIASTSVMSEMVKGMKLEDAMKIKPQDIVKKLGGLPEQKIHCSVLGDQALRVAIKNYRNEKTK